MACAAFTLARDSQVRAGARRNAKAQAHPGTAGSSTARLRPASACTCGGRCPRCTAQAQGERQDGVVHGPAGGTNTFNDCPTSWRPKANAAQKLGSSWVDNVVNGLSLLPSPIPARVSTLLTRHFHTTHPKDLDVVLARYRSLAKAIKQAIDFQCETSCDKDVLAYVYSIWSDLHLCPYWFNSAADLQASTVIHELAHDVIGADDNAYEWETAKYTRMSVKEAMNNADSFAHFAWDASQP